MASASPGWPARIDRRLPDEPRPAADRAERVDRAIVLGEVPGVGRGRPSIPQTGSVEDDVVDDRLRAPPAAARGSLGSPATVAGPGDATKSARPRRTWTSSARIESAISSAVSAPRSIPAGARSAASRSSREAGLLAEPLRGRRPRASATRRARHTGVPAERGRERLLVPVALGRDDDVRAASGRPPRGRSGLDRSAAGNAVGVRDRVEQRHLPAGGGTQLASAPAIGVVPATHRSGAGRFGST